MKLIYTILLLFNITVFGYAEKIDGPANIRSGPNDILLFSLNDLVEVECTVFKNNWCKVMIRISLTDADIFDNCYVKEGTTLFDWNGNEIGKTLNKVEFLGYSLKEDKKRIELQGYTHISNIKTNSIVENDLIQLASKKTHLNYTDLKEHISNFNYYKDKQFSGYMTYNYYESGIEDPSPGDRIRLFFKGNRLISIVHTRKLDLPNMNDNNVIWGYKMLTSDDIDINKKNKIIDLYKDFIKSVD